MIIDRPIRFVTLFAVLAAVGCARNVATAADVPPRVSEPRQMEKLTRGIVAIAKDNGEVFVSWRLLGTEARNTAFDVFRSTDDIQPVKLNDQPLTKGTWFVDGKADISKKNAYSVRVAGRNPTSEDRPFVLPAGSQPKPNLSVPMQTPDGYSPNDCSVGDLDGDGEYEIVVHQAGKGHDNSQAGPGDQPILQAYTLVGKLLWTINLGKNIREGAHYTQFMVYDLDGDGRAEVVCKTADGTVDGVGTVIGDANADHVNKGGYILKGPEYLTVFDGLTGKAMATTKYIPGRHPETEDPTEEQLKAVWGDGYGNRCDRFLACVAYLDGVHPSVVMCRGYYTRTVLAAWDWRDGQFKSRWVFDSGAAGNKTFAGQGNHNLTVADVDGDGCDEIIYGGMCINADGTGRYSTGLGHGDAMHVGDLDPTRPGLEVYRIQERFDDAGAHLFDARTGQVLWKRPSIKKGSDGEGPGRGLSADIDPRYPGEECWSSGAGITGLVDIKGEKISSKTPGSCNFAIWWDGDELRELLDHTTIAKWNWQNESVEKLLDAKSYDCRSNNGTKGTPALQADLFGDWREEVIWPTTDGKELRIFSTTIPTERRIYTLMHDPQYRLSIAWQNVAYNQPPHTGFSIGPKKRARSDVLYTINIKSGEVKVVHRDSRWLGHVQFSPVDPDLCMFCEEGNCEKVDRIWLINPSKSTVNADGSVSSNARIAYRRTEPREIVGHEFWHPDGKSVWFQQAFRARASKEALLSRMDVGTGKVTQYVIPPGFVGIHQTFSPDGSFLISDGTGKDKTGPNKYISKLTLPTDGSNVFAGEHLVTMQDNDYAVEPNPHVSPDNRWVTFTATLHGTAQAYAVELPRR